MSNSPTAQAIDLDVGDLRYDMLGTQPRLSYIRYNVELEVASLTELGFHRLTAKLETSGI